MLCFGEQCISSKAVALSDYTVLEYVASQLLYLMPFACLLRAAEGTGNLPPAALFFLTPAAQLAPGGRLRCLGPAQPPARDESSSFSLLC